MRRAPLAVLLLLALAGPARAQTPSAPAVNPRAVLGAMEDAFASVAERVTPAVVNVSTSVKRGAGERSPEALERFREFFGDEFFDRFFKRRREEGRATGSGVIVDPAGYVLTNNHVVENADEITVTLSDARKLTARLVGRDPKTDLAVLKVESGQPLPAAVLGDSDRLRVGQWAIAIGNPFGLDRTVTVGIVSATARNRVGVATYENFIQTDASINPGNSGGPLLDIDGRVIGINTAIVATGQGIGFSIPINTAKDVLRQLIASGRVVRGWLGIAIQDLTDDLAKSFGVAERQGILVADVMKGGPAEAAGLKPGDVIVEFASAPVREVPELQRAVAGVAPGRPVSVVVVREGKRVSVTVTLGEMPSEEAAAPASTDEQQERWGMAVDALTDEIARRFDLSTGRGVVVSQVAPGSPADRAGLRRGDVILEVDKKPVADPEALFRLLDALAPGASAPVYV
ncbi:MAG: DegQ family serine endoprotease, partial [Candidatus Rokubacteria bacterium]|nr:DegQ family serine endoprotease [Candidatus Rokubacteria bacterium]